MIFLFWPGYIFKCFSYIKAAEASKKIWTTGCVEEVRVWLERNLYTIACVALGVALAQVKNVHDI